jgi:hypothetical protein
MIEANCQNARKLRVVFSYHVASRRQCFASFRNRSTRFRSLYKKP